MTQKNNYSDHSTFSGFIYSSDFNTENPASRNIASRIISDWKFDAQCKTNQKYSMNYRKDESNVKI